MSTSAPDREVCVVLVGGAWGAPEDWQWVVTELDERGVRSTIVDLPSLRTGDATRAEDVAEARRAIEAAAAPTIAVGWSYGGSIISDAALGQPNVARLVYVAAIPQPSEPVAGDAPPLPAPDMSHVLFPNEQTCVLDDNWWLTDGIGATLPEHVIEQLWNHRRRPMSLTALLEPQLHDAWRTIPTTVVLGRDDELNPKECRDWVSARFTDVRIVEGDHFILFRTPAIIADIIVEAATTVA